MTCGGCGAAAVAGVFRRVRIFFRPNPYPILFLNIATPPVFHVCPVPWKRFPRNNPVRFLMDAFPIVLPTECIVFFGLSSCSVHIEPSGSLRVFLSEHLRERTIKKHRRFFTLEKITTLFPSILLSVNLYYRVQSTIHYLSKGIR